MTEALEAAELEQILVRVPLFGALREQEVAHISRWTANSSRLAPARHARKRSCTRTTVQTKAYLHSCGDSNMEEIVLRDGDYVYRQADAGYVLELSSLVVTISHVLISRCVTSQRLFHHPGGQRAKSCGVS